jgi:hypothetical protein
MPPKKRAALRSNRRKPLRATPAKALPGTIDQDRLLTETLRSAADAFNAALANARAAGIEVQQQMVELESIGDEPLIHAHPINLGRILRRY